MNRFEGKVVIVTGPAPVSVLAQRAAFYRKVRSLSSMDGVSTSCTKPSQALMQQSYLFIPEMCLTRRM